ncbi:probable RNA-binding protein 19 [Anthonomus grandis grandis]|uniref:probable RNA-binding protein 19 n=1 Tax=Anthonomus grandis grandis TaxID=2921223 RepID=UPI0021663975|nr:probable RNA-binding protein 19 [Anthonomus grandis grandis]XP_050311763.1 probable RNA-binding protein 19 [Anthonomus grandis grandis]
MSRLIVKNLPKTVTEDKLRELFCNYGTITDVQLKYTKEGTFRRFSFVGYQNEEDADKAVQNLNNTFINTSKISVEKCALLGDSAKPKAWSKYAPDSSAFQKKNKPKKEKIKKETEPKVKKDEALEILEKYKDDPMFKEFMQAHGKGEKLEKLRENLIKLQKEHDKPQQKEDEGAKTPQEPLSDLDYMKMLMQGVKNSEVALVERKPRQKMEKKPKEKVKLFHLKLKDLPYKVKKKDIKEFFRPNTPFSIRIPRDIRGIAFVGYKTEKAFKKAVAKDKSFIKGKQIQVTPYEVKGQKQEEEPKDPKKGKWKSQEEALKNEEDIAESGKIFLRNLAYTTTEKEVEELFSKYGPIAEINLPIDSASRKPKGFGVVTFVMPEHAVKAYADLDGSVLHGRMMHLLPGKAKDLKEDEESKNPQNFKQKKLTQQKTQAGSAHNWNALFLGHDAVAEVIADNFDVDKSAVVGPDGKGSAAVRLAIGETQLVTQTRQYLEENGVQVDVFNLAPKVRSKTVILVKNLPSRTDPKEIRDVFAKFGDLGRVLMPPSGITAIVEFIEPSEARKAFAKLAYSKFKNTPLYLEWAPENSLLPEKEKTENVVVESNGPIEEEEEEEEELDPEPDSTLFVKNLNFETTDEGLKKHFSACGKIKYANVATKKDKNNPGAKLSMGYGFVQYYLKKSADTALKTLQQSQLDGKSLEIKRSERTLKNDVVASSTARKTAKVTKQTGSKLLVRNVPFQANRKEVFELFSTFGEIKALRLPKKLTPGAESHRGFAFVDYVSPTDAKSAFEALSQSTHLYGRRLVLEWATTEEGVEEIRKRTAEHFGEKEEVKSKKSVFNIE